MPEYLAPGVFVEEVDSGSKPIEGVGTNTAAFVGYAKSGEFNKPTFVTSWTDFCRIFGEDESHVIRSLSAAYGIPYAQLLKERREYRKTLLDYAMNVVKQNGGEWTDFVRKYEISLNSSPYLEGSYLAYSVRGYYLNGGGRAYIMRIPSMEDEQQLKALPAGGGRKAEAAKLELGGLTIKALEAGAKGNDITVKVDHPTEDANQFTVTVSDGETTESYGDKDNPIDAGKAKAFFSKQASKLVDFKLETATMERPQNTTFNLLGGMNEVTTNLPVVHSTHELARVKGDDFIGDESKRTGFMALAELDDVNMILVPDLMAGVFQRNPDTGAETLVLTEQKKKAIIQAQSMLISFCEGMGDRSAILDPIPGCTPQEIRDTVKDAPFNSPRGHASYYYPWIKVVDENPENRGARGERFQRFVPPGGHVAGVWCRAVDEVGVHKAPANMGLYGAVALEWDVSKREQEILNPDGINCIRQFPNEGIKVWGARTLATVGNPSWKYVNVRRLFDYLKVSMDRGLRWAVFEPNDDDLWGRVRRTLNAFLWTEWKQGKLFGTTPQEAFYVKCDRETNPQEMIDLGRMYVEIGINPVKPAEFVIIQLGQWHGGSESSEL